MHYNAQVLAELLRVKLGPLYEIKLVLTEERRLTPRASTNENKLGPPCTVSVSVQGPKGSMLVHYAGSLPDVHMPYEAEVGMVITPSTDVDMRFMYRVDADWVSMYTMPRLLNTLAEHC